VFNSGDAQVFSSPADTSLPAWALAQAEAALTVGQTIPEIERSLVAKGLAAETVTAAITTVLEKRIRATAPWPRYGRMRAHRVASVMAGVVCSGLAYAHDGGYSALWSAFFLIGPVTCIWFAEALSKYARPLNPWNALILRLGLGRDMWLTEPVLIRLVAWLVVACIGLYHVVSLTG
jgi:hypothetical protein